MGASLIIGIESDPMRMKCCLRATPLVHHSTHPEFWRGLLAHKEILRLCAVGCVHNLVIADAGSECVVRQLKFAPRWCPQSSDNAMIATVPEPFAATLLCCGAIGGLRRYS
jgi:hypothetical protein